MLSKQEIEWAKEAVKDAPGDPLATIGALNWAAKVIDSHEELREALGEEKCLHPVPHPELGSWPTYLDCGECAPCRAREL